MSVRLHLSHHQTPQGLSYQQIFIELTESDRLMEPQNLVNLELPAELNHTQGVVLSGRAPIWLYSYLVHKCYPSAWVACHDPRLGAVVVATHSRQAQIGQVLPIDSSVLSASTLLLCPALLIVGPPDSGKSILSHALFKALLESDPDVHLQRAQWDGEGNYVLELGQHSGHSGADLEAFKAANRGRLSDRFFPYLAHAISNLRKQKSLVVIDVGGMIQPEKQPLLEVCTHYLIISSNPNAIASWHEFCYSQGNLTTVAIIHSTLETCEFIHQQEPYLELTCGAWIREQARVVPTALMERVQTLLLKRRVI